VQPETLAVTFRDELDRRTLVMLLGLADVVEERRVQERQNPTDDPAALVLVSIGADHHLAVHPRHRTKPG